MTKIEQSRQDLKRINADVSRLLDYAEELEKLNQELGKRIVHQLKIINKNNDEYISLKEKAKELIKYYHDFEVHGRNYNLIFRTIVELEKMVGIKNE